MNEKDEVILGETKERKNEQRKMFERRLEIKKYWKKAREEKKRSQVRRFERRLERRKVISKKRK